MEYRPEDRAGAYLLQRLRIRSDQPGKPILLVHDVGDDATVRGVHRRFRRHSLAPGAKTGGVCDETMWDELRPVWRTEVTNARRDAVVVWP
ncbi:hypothetical protein [Curtobacterium sp. MCLR17_054]|uniref:hypothetical protein n=1 Tax=Curtobacterium sp. MCLR17_054 TaxID=2175632 RepID=UPI000DA8BD80|nr:hypothetical protein [Curtobacterium sp. MCLR17_054]WIE67934.1 hypothetical protein DEJ08_015730 [Curtobacterium sp. MCLR17_054]